MKRKVYRCQKCGHLTEFKSFWKWLFIGLMHIDPIGIRWFKCSCCGKYSKHKKINLINLDS